jgi:hypothetical protein
MRRFYRRHAIIVICDSFEYQTLFAVIIITKHFTPLSKNLMTFMDDPILCR